ncbi:MAG: protein dithiol:quinone oxidoreductase [Pseudomonadota bacterium]|jgi:disulfide bond formation protein DsbB|nr:protein dithiol:quinone oxidoreductase [Pseudomonadota bacterium]
MIGPMNILATVRGANAAGFLVCCALIGYALYAQYVLGLDPCPLCIFQRVALIGLGLMFLIAAVFPAGPVLRKFHAILIGLMALAGSGVAARQLWLQALPPERVPACGPGLDFMLEAFPVGEVLMTVLSGSGECAKVDWTLLGLSMPGWVLLALTGLGIFGVLLNWRGKGWRIGRH